MKIFQILEYQMAATETIYLGEEKVHVAVMGFGDATMITVSDGALFGPIYKVTKSQKGANEPVITVDGVFGEQHDYAQVVCRHLRLHCRVETEQLLASVLLKRDLVTRDNLKELVDTVNKLIAN